MAEDWRERRLHCDIVMAGGVTSGVVYPAAALEISRRYRFHSLAGASAGANAAAAAAAAEYARLRHNDPDGFQRVADMAARMGETGADGHTRLYGIFQPQRETAALFALAAPLFSRRGKSVALRLAGAALAQWRISAPGVVVALLGLRAAFALFSVGHGLLALGAALVSFVAGAAASLAMFAALLRWLWLPAWRANGYGLCTGSAGAAATSDPSGNQHVTDWVHEVVQSAAGRRASDDPVTFGDLWTADDAGRDAGDADARRAIELVVVASDISRNRVAHAPFLEAPSPLYISASTLQFYFPPAIARWMIEKARPCDGRVVADAGVMRLPLPQDLPLVFATRLSFGFPALLSAVPLLTPDFAGPRDAEGRLRLRPVWFSDGGVVSNFPIQFFDEPLPSRPTFGINFVSYGDEAPNVAAYVDDDDPHCGATLERCDEDQPIADPMAPSRAQSQPIAVKNGKPQPGDPVWGYVSAVDGATAAPAPFSAFDGAGFQGVAALLSAVLNTARFWGQNQLMLAPGVRDRIVNIALNQNEGGLNLDMSAQTIADLIARGQAAGMLIANRFDPTPALDPTTGKPGVDAFPQHRWIRYRAFMAAIENLTRRFNRARIASDAAAAERAEPDLNAMIDGAAPVYPAPESARAFFRTQTDGLYAYGRAMEQATARGAPPSSFDPPGSTAETGAAPRPKMRLREQPVDEDETRAPQRA
ncbi:MAG: patatin-like phospholipase family protein [Hyphomicrobiales bacterium]|nr:patatin-like phospholipase family protein [Hyphomicrobiales bacterium]